MSDLAKKDALGLILADLVQSSVSESTKRAYRLDWSTFKSFCESSSLDELPADPNTVALFITYLYDADKKPATIRRALTTISQAHKLSGFESPITDTVRLVERSIRKKKGTAQKKASPIGLEMLDRLIKNQEPSANGNRNIAALLLSWCAALRASELLALDWEDLRFVDEGLIVTVRKSKTDQEGAGRQIAIPFLDARPTVCAVRALMALRQRNRATEGPIFRAYGAMGRQLFATKGKRLSFRGWAKILKQAVKYAGYDSVDFSTHSLRSGFVTEAAKQGIPNHEIMGQSGHRSVATLEGYIRAGTLFTICPLIKMVAVTTEPSTEP